MKWVRKHFREDTHPQCDHDDAWIIEPADPCRFDDRNAPIASHPQQQGLPRRTAEPIKRPYLTYRCVSLWRQTGTVGQAHHRSPRLRRPNRGSGMVELDMRIKPAHIIIAGAALGGAFVGIYLACSFDIQPAGVTYPDLIAVMLTGISILLAVVGLGLAALALLGWSTFRSITEKAAGEAALAHIKADGAGRIDTVIEARVTAFITEGYANGTLPALAEQRVIELEKARELDLLDEMDQWSTADTSPLPTSPAPTPAAPAAATPPAVAPAPVAPPPAAPPVAPEGETD